ncbi:MAG: Lrp/AsnC family transcriptional regulator [Nanoarchaeota archaeon]|nr:Lrp/AsnC family transcriptional regulator [Nanoarchaeota archaeon]
MVEKLDLKDRKILFELEQNSRQSLNQISKSVRLKKETVFYRIKNLEKRGIIKNYLTEINIYKLGYQFYPMLLKFQNSTPEVEEKIYKYLLNNKYIAWLTKCEGAWDVNLTLITKSNFQVDEFLNNFLRKFSRYILDKCIFITTELHYFKRGFWLDKTTTQIVSMGEEKTIEIDKKDFKLLNALAIEARKSLVEIGDFLKTNPKNISYRLKRLETQEIIQGYKILTDFTKMEYKFYKIFFSLKNTNKDNFNKLMQYFKNHPNIIWATKIIGSYDISIEMEVKDVQMFRSILDEIKEKFSYFIKKHESLLIFEEGTMNYFPSSQI